jgi:hypothetical protein
LEIWVLDALGSSDKPNAFMWFFIIDASLGTIKGVLLYCGLKQRDAVASSTSSCPTDSHQDEVD